MIINKGGTKEALANIHKDWSDHFKEALKRRAYFRIDKADLVLKVNLFLCLSFDFKANICLPMTT